MSEDTEDSLEKSFEKVDIPDEIRGSHSEPALGADNKAEPWYTCSGNQSLSDQSPTEGDGQELSHAGAHDPPRHGQSPQSVEGTHTTGVHQRNDIDLPEVPAPQTKTRMVCFSYSSDQMSTPVIQCMLENKFPGKAYKIEQEEPGELFLYFHEEIDVCQVEVNIGGSLVQVTPLDAPSNREDCTAINIQQMGIDPSGLTPSEIENQKSMVRLYLKNRVQSGGGSIEDIYFNEKTAQFTVTFAEAAVAQNVRAKHDTTPFELDRCMWAITELKPSIPAPLVVGDTEPTRLIFRGLPPSATREQFESYLHKWKPGVMEKIEYAMVPGVAMLELQREQDDCEFRRLVAQRPFVGTMISVQAVPSLRSIQIHGIPDHSDDRIELHYEDDDPGIVAALRRDGSVVIVTFHTRDQVLRASQKPPPGGGWERTFVRLYFETFGLILPSHDPVYPPVVCPKPEFIQVNKEIIHWIKTHQQLMLSATSHLEAFNTKLLWPRDDDQPVKMECTLTNMDRDAGKKVSTWRVDAVREMRKACQFQTVLCSNLPITASTEVIAETLGKLPEVDSATLIVHDLDRQRKTARATYRSVAEESGLRSKWTISIHQAEVKCELVLVDVQGRKTSVREGEIRTIVFKKLPTCLGPVMSIFLTNLVENKSRYGGGPVERVHYDHGLKLAVVLLRQVEDAEEFVRLNPSLVVAGECVPVSLAEYNLSNPDEIFALKVVKARSTIKSHEIELYMENKVPGFTLKFEDLEGGDTIVSCEDHRGIDELLRKHKHEPFTWNQNRLILEELRPSPPPSQVTTPSPSVIVVRGLTPRITDKELVDYFKDAGCEVVEIQNNRENETRLVKMKTEPDFRRLWRHTDRRPLKGHVLSIHRIPLPISAEIVDVTGLSQKVLDLYFSNQERSGGGPVVNIDMSSGGSYATVQFASNEVLLRVLAKKHHIHDKQLDVKVYYPGFGTGRNILLDLPNLDSTPENELATPGRQIKFRLSPDQLEKIHASEKCKEKINTALFEIGGEVQWQEADGSIRVAFIQGANDVRWNEWVALTRDVIKQVVEDYF